VHPARRTVLDAFGAPAPVAPVVSGAVPEGAHATTKSRAKLILMDGSRSLCEHFERAQMNFSRAVSETILGILLY
jgi:hypothetical protein